MVKRGKYKYLLFFNDINYNRDIINSKSLNSMDVIINY